MSSPPPKLKSYKNDLAPTLFYFEPVLSDLFVNPVMPIPMRIDRITNGQPTHFIIPDLNKIDELIKNLELKFSLNKLYIEGLKNLISYAKRKYKEITYRTLTTDILYKWYTNSLNLECEIPSLKEDYYFLISEFIKMFSDIETQGVQPESESYLSRNVDYCDAVIKYFKDKIEENKFQIIEKGKVKIVHLYKEKKDKYYPDIIPIGVKNLKKNKINKLTFVPYLIYDDLLDCFAYNKKLLNDKIEQPIDILLWKNKEIINKRSNINKNNQDFNIKNFKITNIKLEYLL